jgi:hypothetical protein
MSKSNTTENDFMLYTFNGTAISWDGNTNLYVALHTADPGEAGNQTTSEATYTSYARVTVARTSGGFTVSGNQASNTALIQFPQCTGGTNTITHVSVGTATSGAGQILYSGALTSSLSVSSGIQPQFSVGALVITED